MTSFINGFFLNQDTIFHRLDARAKILGLILWMCCIFIYGGIETYLYLSLIILGCLIIARVPIFLLRKTALPVVFIFVFLCIIGMFVTVPSLKPGPHLEVWIAWFHIQIGALHITVYNQAIYRAVYITWRIILMMMVTLIFTTTTKPFDIALAIEKLLFFLKYLKIPVNVIAMMLSITLRFMPEFFAQVQRINKAQASRGIEFQGHSLRQKAKMTTSLIIPLCISAFQKADDLANAMVIRGYDPSAPRTQLTKFTWKLSDGCYLIFLVGFLTFVILHMYAWNYGLYSELLWFFNLTGMEPSV